MMKLIATTVWFISSQENSSCSKEDYSQVATKPPPDLSKNTYCIRFNTLQRLNWLRTLSKLQLNLHVMVKSPVFGQFSWIECANLENRVRAAHCIKVDAVYYSGIYVFAVWKFPCSLQNRYPLLLYLLLIGHVSFWT